MNKLKLNKYLTELTDELLDLLPEEVKEELLDVVYNVPFIKHLISDKREYAKDRPRDKKGRIIIDLAHPHILEDMNYFRESAIYYQKHGVYTKVRPNANPNSEYGKWIRLERDRCWNGMVRESDGEWIPGALYYHLNYCPIIQSKIREGTKQADRIVDFPEVWEGVYWRFHYMDLARSGGKYNDFLGGNHGAELASRGKSKSYSMASILARNFVLGENKEAHKETRSLVTAYQKEYLTKDGVLNKFVSMADFAASNTLFPRKRLKSSYQDMTWIMGFIDLLLGIDKGSLNQVIGVSSRDDSSKLRGKRAVFIGIEEFGCHLKGTGVMMFDGSIKKVEDVLIGDKLMGDDATEREVLESYSGIDDMYKITLSNGDTLVVNSKHPIHFVKYDWNTKSYKDMLLTAPEVMKIKNLNKGHYILKSDKVKFDNRHVEIDPYLLGLWLGDGDSTRVTIANEDPEVITYIEDFCNTNNFKLNKTFIKASKSCYTLGISSADENGKIIKSSFEGYNLLNNKHIPEDYKYNDRQTLLLLIAGLIDSDGTLNNKKKYFEITLKHTRKQILDSVKFMCESIGLKCSMSTKITGKNAKKPGMLHYRLRISGLIELIPTKIKRKLFVREEGERLKRNWNEYTFKVEPYGKGEYYGFLIDKNHLFLLDDFTIVHNTFPRLLDLYNVLKPSVQEGEYVFGLMYLLGTSGDKDSDFSGAQEIMYNPHGYNMYALPNVFDKDNQGRKLFVFFYPAYVNRKGCYDKNGVSDIIKALIELLLSRYKIKYNSDDPNTILRVIAEEPITPAEAIIKTGLNLFPILELTERLLQIDNDVRIFDDVYIADLVLDKDNNIKYNISFDSPIRNIKSLVNTMGGAIEILLLPEKNREGKVFPNRYILSCDPYDNDLAESKSLGSIFVLDLWTDKIVAEYTGRPMFADDFYEIARKMILFYNGRMNYENNKKGLFAYFQRMNCLYLLTDNLEFLRDKELVKTRGFGNSAKGTTATQAVNGYARSLLRNWLLQPVNIIIEEDEEMKEVTTARLFTLKSRALIEELIAYNDVGNFDRISSMMMLMLLREDKMIMYGGDLKASSRDDTNSANYLGNDPFFKGGYKSNSKSKNRNNFVITDKLLIT